MIKVYTSELIGPMLNYAVAKSLGWIDYPNDSIERGLIWHCDPDIAPRGRVIPRDLYAPSTDATQGLALVEKEISNFQRREGYFYCSKYVNGQAVWAYGPTLLIAAMRCIVLAQLGPEVDIPEDLCKSGV